VFNIFVVNFAQAYFIQYGFHYVKSCSSSCRRLLHHINLWKTLLLPTWGISSLEHIGWSLQASQHLLLVHITWLHTLNVIQLDLCMKGNYFHNELSIYDYLIGKQMCWPNYVQITIKIDEQ